MEKNRTNQILLATSEKGHFESFISALEDRDNISLAFADSGAEVLKAAKAAPLDLVITDETLSDMTGLVLADQLLRVNAMIGCAAVSTLSHKDFHEASEGLGILAQLPPRPGIDEAESLLAHLDTIQGL